jgi:hydrogenase maturation protein HypF
VLRIEPQIIAHDLHPDFYSTRYAARRAAANGLPAIAVQHHHAHIAAVMAEHGLAGPVLGLALDGVGLGTDGRAWGGELLRVDGGGFERVGHLRDIALPGGDRAAREPWRMAAAALHALDRASEIERRYPYPAARTVMQMLKDGIHCPSTSSMGRWFDAACGLLGVIERQSFEGQAPMLLEGLAARHGPVDLASGGYQITDGVLDMLPLMLTLVDEGDPLRGAARFHATLVEALTAWCVDSAHGGARHHRVRRRLLHERDSHQWTARPVECRRTRGCRAAPGSAQRRRHQSRTGLGRACLCPEWLGTTALKACHVPRAARPHRRTAASIAGGDRPGRRA